MRSALACLGITLATSCADLEVSENDSASETAVEVDPVRALGDQLGIDVDDPESAALESLLQAPVARDGEGEPDDVDARLGNASEDSIQKIRHGTAIDYDHQVANSIVSISFGGAGCTGQVINRYVILTAGHCVDDQWNHPGTFSRSYNTLVDLTRRDGSKVRMFNGPAYAAPVPNWAFGARDIALIYLPGGMQTCYGTNSWCAANRPDIPVNGQFQYYDASVAPPQAASIYVMAGYGGTDAYYNGLGVLRFGVPQALSYARTASSLAIRTRWTNDSQSRTCYGDSGGPLIPIGAPLVSPPPSPNRNFYTGIASGAAYSDPMDPATCSDQSGTTVYAAITLGDMLWISLALQYIANTEGRQFTCSGVPNLPAPMMGFQCAN